MTMKTLWGLCAVTVAAIVLAIVAVNSQPSFKSSDTAGEPVFPTLTNDLNRLATVVVQSKEGTYTLDFDGTSWTFRDRGGYPADGSKIAEAVIKIARMTKLEAKTKLPDRFARLDLQDPGSKDSRAKQVTLLDKNGGVLADVIVGKRKFTLGSKEGGTYIRLPGDDQTWLVFGELNPGEKARDWLKRDIVDIKDDAIKQVTVTHPDGEIIVAGQSAPSDPNFKILNMPEGVEQTSDFVADDFGRLLAILLLDDVKPATEIQFPKDQTISADFEGFAGFHVHLDYAEIDGKHWIKVHGEPPSAASMDATAGVETNKTEADEAGPDWAKTIAELNDRTSGWVDELPAHEASALKK
ncbi:MAG: DUF4340 domain-containing protein, partial [Rhodobacteraceae bacterium]|nr:DUF4340 domain-containing protein [Paracoccaceae bacterium]